MPQVAQEPQCLTPIPASVMQQLSEVLDPEIDESIVDLGFVESFRITRDQMRIELRLPTSWCSPNFAYMMAEDVRQALLSVETVRQVYVALKDHVAAERIEPAVNSGMSFEEAFPDEALGNLDELRLYFLHKGFLKRQEELLRELLRAGLSFGEIAVLDLGDLEVGGDFWRIRREDGHWSEIASTDAANRYLQRRAELGLDCSRTAALVTDDSGHPIPADRLQRHYITVRTVRVAQEANSSMCCALLAARRRSLSGRSQTENER
jgi:metal-sulfur cluster biosynthetic enzyme